MINCTKHYDDNNNLNMTVNVYIFCIEHCLAGALGCMNLYVKYLVKHWKVFKIVKTFKMC